MAVIRLIAVDPYPRVGESDLVVYQVPEHSRAQELLVELLSKEGIEFVVLESEQQAMPEEERNKRKREYMKKYHRDKRAGLR